MTLPKSIPTELIDTLLSGYQKPEDLLGENGLLKQLTKLRRVRTAYLLASNVGTPLFRYAVRTLVSYLSPWLATLALRQKELVRTLKVRPWHVD